MPTPCPERRREVHDRFEVQIIGAQDDTNVRSTRGGQPLERAVNAHGLARQHELRRLEVGRVRSQVDAPRRDLDRTRSQLQLDIVQSYLSR